MSTEATATTETTTTDAAAADASAAATETDTATDSSGGESTQDQETVLGGATETSEASGDTAGSDTSAEATAPESYADFELPEGFTMDTDFLGAMTPAFKEAGLTQESAQSLVSAYAQFRKSSAEKDEAVRADAFNKLTGDWLQQVKDDKDIGGDNFKTTVAHANAALEKFGSPGLKTLFNEMGLGNHPELVRFAARIGAHLREDSGDGSRGNAVQPPKDRSEILYPSS